MSHLDDALQYAGENQSNFLDELKAFLRIPSISTQPDHTADVAAAAAWLVENMSAAGLENARVIKSEAGKHPLVYADWLHAGHDRPTVVIYGHFDVQPPDPLDLWETPPFEPTEKDGYLVARGSSDDKGQAFVHIKAAEAYLKSNGALPVNVKFIYEGEEESGGETLKEFLPKHTELLKGDIALVSDTSILGPDQPSIVYGLRGIVYDFIDLYGPSHDLHSGSRGGAIDNPLNVIGHIIANLKDQDGKILIPGFYDNVRELEQEERDLLAQLPLDPDEWLAETGAPKLWGESDYSLVERIGARPTLDVHGLVGGYTDPGAKTIIPSHVHAKISMRLVPNQDPERIGRLFREYVRSITPDTMRVEFKHNDHSAPPSITDYTLPAMEAARVAYTEVFGKEPVLTREGGSIPVVADFQTHLGLETVLMGFGLSTDLIHSPNERFLISLFYKGIDTVIHFFEHYGSMPR